MLTDRIKRICKEKGISISCLEREAGLSNGAISKWSYSSPSVNNLKAVAKVLHYSLDELAGEEEAVKR